jgi:hypothetical protein
MSNDPNDIKKTEEQAQAAPQAPSQELPESELSKAAGGTTTLSNLANMIHDMQKTVVNNIRA